ncbi:YlaH-like family protein [Halalkalibacter sp. APA_J-10(15)]|uniref:YlaH-like family protein n=1 Tax=unclassified Halalkalibacter TaxID=2893063 RepID=UPI001FF6763A|nr:YlaH-like family protein [Halalkalibacter sp. APA_J-10(15)]MCK0470604.1 YlaH-like family protein [Halalkalibacter sp. APA_J-10(15)]
MLVGSPQISEENLEQLTWLMRATTENPWYGFYGFLAIVALAIIVFNLGFAKKLPILKRVLVYITLIIGCFVLWFLEFFFGAPIIVVLIISGLVLGIYRFRLHLHRQQKKET